MSHYFFKVDGDEESAVGFEFADDRAAWAEAVAACGDLIRRGDRGMDPGQSWRMLVSDHAGEKVFALEFSSQSYRDTDSRIT